MSDATRTLHSGLLASSPLRHIGYQYDTWNNVTVRDDLVNDIREQFDYDRLTATTLSSDRHLGDIETSQNQSYDVYGNISHKSDVGSYQYDPTRPHAVSQAGGHDYSVAKTAKQKIINLFFIKKDSTTVFESTSQP